MKYTPTEAFLFVCLIIVSTFTMSREQALSPSFSNLSYLQEYIQKIIPAGDHIVVLFTSGTVYNADRKPIYFRDEITIETMERSFIEKDYTFISINTNCLAGDPECIQEFTDLALAISKLEPKALIYKGIDNGIGNVHFKDIMQDKGIPIYTYGTEVLVNYEVYAGPDNKGLGEYAFDAVKEYIIPGQTALYIETVRGLDPIENSKFDNGFPRINSIRNLMREAGVETAATLFTQWSEALTYTQLLSYLGENPVPNYIFTPSGETTLGVIHALETLGIEGQVKIVCLDFTDEIREWIEEGRIYAAVTQRMTKQIEYIVERIGNIGKEDKKEPHKKLFAGPYITKQVLETADVNKLY